jgi:hypothetical protein
MTAGKTGHARLSGIQADRVDLGRLLLDKP